MDDNTRFQLCKNAGTLGKQTFLQQTIEECAELQKAICKYNRTQGIGQITETTSEEAMQNLVEEIADVAICLESLQYLLSIESDVNNAIVKAVEKVRKRLDC